MLSAAGLKNINRAREEEYFTFIIGEQTISLNRISAEFISPLVSHIHYSDPTLNSINYDKIIEEHYEHDNKDKNINVNTKSHQLHISQSHQEKLEKISNGESIEITSSEMDEFLLLSILIGNEELYNKINMERAKDCETRSVASLLKELEHYKYMRLIMRNECVNFSSLIDNISQQFSSIEKEKLFDISLCNLKRIISNEHFNIENEDDLLDIINDIFKSHYEQEEQYLYEEELDIIHFYEHIDVSKLSEDKFEEYIIQLRASEMTEDIWCHIRARIINKGHGTQDSPNKSLTKSNQNEIFYNGGSDPRFEGIIHQLTEEAGGNVHDKGVVNVTASSEYIDGDRNPKNVVDFDSYKWFRSQGNPNSWLEYDFKERKVKPTHYSIKSKPYGKDDHHPMHWVIEGSNDRSEWKTLDTRSGETCLRGRCLVHTFEIQEQLSDNDYFRYLRIRQTGKNANNSNDLGFTSLEYFGTITSS